MPNDVEVLFYWGQLLAWNGRKGKGEKILLKALSVDPDYTPAMIALADIYMRKKEWSKAESLLDRCKDNSDADFSEANMAYLQKNYSKAQRLFSHILQKNQNNIDARRGLARSLAACLQYKEAKTQYVILSREQPKNPSNWRELAEVRSHTGLSFYAEGLYTRAKEGDRALNASVVRDYYTYASAALFVPVVDRWRVDVKEIFYHQKERDIYPPLLGINYNIYIQGGQLTSRYFFAKNREWDVTFRLIGAYGRNSETFFPFVQTTRFEPGTLLSFSGNNDSAFIGAYVESFIIKDFLASNSRLLRTIVLHSENTYRPNIPCQPEATVGADEIFYHDSIHNQRYDQNLSLKGNVYFSFWKALYSFENSVFQHLSLNYYTYRRRVGNTLGTLFHFDILPLAYLEAAYEHRWEITYNLSTPIGATIFTAPSLYVLANKVTLRTGYQYKDKMKVGLEGHFFISTFPYQDWNIRGNFLWQF